MVGRPQVLYKDIDGEKNEPFELCVLDIPEGDVGTITETLSKRKGIMEGLAPLGEGRSRMEFKIPSRGLIGYRGQFLTDTRGEGLMSSQFLGYEPYAGDLLSRQNGAIIADRGERLRATLFSTYFPVEDNLSLQEKLFLKDKLLVSIQSKMTSMLMLSEKNT